MKIRVVKIGICIAVFISLVATVFAFLNPLYQRIGDEVKNRLEKLCLEVFTKTGARISYGSFSPSIISGVNIYDIKVTDSQSRRDVVTIGRASLRYDLIKLLREGVSDGLQELVIHDVEAVYEDGVNDSWLHTFLMNYGKKKKVQEASGTNRENKIETALEKLNFDGMTLKLPVNVRIYRLHASYLKQGLEISGNINDVLLAGNPDSPIDAVIHGNVKVSSKGRNFSSDFLFDADIPQKINDSTAVIRLSNLTDGNYSIKTVGWLVDYKDRNVAVKMLPDSRNNIYMEFSTSVDSGEIRALFDAREFSFSRLVKTARRNKLEKTLFDLTLSINASCVYDYRKNGLSYSSHGNVFVPASVIPSGNYACDMNVLYSISGDRKNLDVKNLTVSSSKYNAGFNGNVNLEKLIPSGELSVESVIMPNGGVISTEIYIDPLSSGFMCVSPQIMFDDRFFSAVQLTVIPSGDSYDFEFELSDYSHAGEGTSDAGVLSVYGSYVIPSKSLQTAVSFDTFHIDTLMYTAAFFADEQKKPFITGPASSFASTVFSCDAYGSLEKKQFSFNLPYGIVANTKQEDQMLIFAADGNRDSLQVTHLELIYGGQNVIMTAQAEKLPGIEGRILNGHLDLNDIPYDFTGLINNGWVSISGDYGLEFSMAPDFENQKVSGTVRLEDFPFNFNKVMVSLSADSLFEYAADKSMQVDFSRFEIRSMNSTRLNPVVSFAGFMDNDGIYFNSIWYTDIVSSLNGTGNIVWTVDSGNFKDAVFDFNVSNPMGFEEVLLSGQVSNPGEKAPSLNSILNEYFVTLGFNVRSMRSSRFVPGSVISDTLNAELNVSGNLANPFAALSISRAGFTVQGNPLEVSADVLLDDKIINIQRASLNFNSTEINDLSAEFSLEKWIGKLDFAVKTVFLNKETEIKVSSSVEAISSVQYGKLPESFNVAVMADVKGGLFDGQGITLNAVKIADELMLNSSSNIGLSGVISNVSQKKKDVSLVLNNDIPLNMSIKGTVTGKSLDLAVDGVRMDIARILKFVEYDFIKIQKGLVTGGFAVSGMTENPQFHGQLFIIPAEFYMPQFFKKHAVADVIMMTLNGSLFYTEPTRCYLHHSPVDVTVTVQLNKLSLETIEVAVQTVGEEFAPVNIDMPQIHVKGNARTDLNIIYEDHSVSVSGVIIAKDANAEFGASRLNEIVNIAGVPNDESPGKKEASVDVALRVKALTRVQISYSTFLRALVVPGSEVYASYSSSDEKLTLDGTVPIRSGEIVYLNSSFYIKSGQLEFSERDVSGTFNPLVSISAETRVRDLNNENITISLSAEKQFFSELSPKISSSPLRSEKEIMEILGYATAGENTSASSLMLATGDYALQVVLIRKIENALRDLLNFDIFSVRTMVVQNTVKYGMTRNEDRKTGYTVGNFLDNTTVYIGKYLNDSIFCDAMVRLDYDQDRINDSNTYQGFSIQPELGVEIEAPFARIRWAVTPDFEKIMNNNWSNLSSLTLSWKFNF